MKKLFITILAVLMLCSCAEQTKSANISDENETIEKTTSLFAHAFVGTALISLEYATDEILSKYDYTHEFIENEDYEKFIFRTDKTVKNLKFISVSFTEKPEFKFIENGELYFIDEFSPEIPLIITWRQIGLIPHRGISVTDNNNVTRCFYIQTSGKDGSLMLNEFTAESTDITLSDDNEI